MFPVSSPTFSKLKCPRLNCCPFGPEICLFSHDPNVYTKGGLDGRIGLSSMTYYKDLQKRMRLEERACKESKLFKTTNTEESKDKLAKAIENDLSTFLHRAPAGYKISVNLREKVLLKLIKAMRQVDAGSTLVQAAVVENELLLKSGGSVSSVYLSSVADYIKKLENEGNLSVPGSVKDEISYEELMEIVANEDSLREYTYPLPCDFNDRTILVDCFDTTKSCRRCGVNFVPFKYYNNKGGESSSKACRYHSGKVEKVGGLRVYGCCHAPIGDSNGCETGEWHVFEGYRKDDPNPKFPFLESQLNTKNIVALDAEMFYTAGGYEVSRVTLVDFHSESTLLDVLIEPRHHPVLDYNTKWSGVSAETYKSGEFAVMKFGEMKEKLAEFIGKETILIGHSLDNDLRVLEFSHRLIVDTAILYPHRARPPYRMSLKSLALGHLSELVQQSVAGHDSKEDCTTCIRLVKKYFKSGRKEIESK